MNRDIFKVCCSLACISILFGCATIKQEEERREPLSSVPVEFKYVKIYDSGNKAEAVLSPDEVNEDCSMLKYLIETAYAGYDAAVANGLSMDTAVQHIEAVFAGQKQIERRKFIKAVEAELRPYISDSHFILSTWNYRCNLCPAYTVYFSNIYVHKTGETFSVCLTDSDTVPLGSTYSDTKNTLFYYPAKGTDVYRIGILASQKTDSMDIHINNGVVSIPVYTDGAIEVRDSNAIKYHELTTDNSVYVGISSFLVPDKHSQFRKGAVLVFDKYATLGVRYQDKKNIIIDLRSNTGGISVYSAALLYSLYAKVKHLNSKKNAFDRKTMDNLYTFERNFGYSEYIVSPAVIQNEIAWNKNLDETNTVRYFENLLEKQKENPVKNTYLERKKTPVTGKDKFDGQVIILTDRNTCSASEETVQMARELFGAEKRVTVIGENTQGCLQYISCFDYQLPHSGIVVHLASADYTPKLEGCGSWHGEGRGMYPDYWAAGDDLLETLVLATGDKELRTRLADIACGLQ